MRELFQYNDYVKVNSSDYIREFEKLYIRFYTPTRNVGYWMRQAKSSDGIKLASLFQGKTLLVQGNRLQVEFPADLANSENMAKMVETVFCDNIRFPLAKDVAGGYELNVELVVPSVAWSFSGRVGTVTFDILVTLRCKVPRLSRDELNNGVVVCTNELSQMAPQISVLQEVVLNPDGVELFGKRDEQFLITKSTDDMILYRKFFLLHRKLFMKDDPLETAYYCARYFFQGTQNKESKKTFFDLVFFRHANFCSYELVQRVKCPDTVKGVLSYAKSLSRALKDCLEEIKGVVPGCHTDARFETTLGFLSLEVGVSQVKQKYLDRMSANLTELLNRVEIIIRFLTEECQTAFFERMSLINGVMRYAFEKIRTDPIMYINDDGKDIYRGFREFALSLI